MDVLRPPIIRIGNRCYRRNIIEGQSPEEYEAEEDIIEQDDVYNDEVCDAFSNVEETNSGYRLSLEIPSAYFKYIIGKGGETKKRLENETRTQIRIPRQGEEGPIVINSKDKKGVLSAKNRIDIMVTSARAKQPFTHFLSIPVTASRVKDALEDFREEVLKSCGTDRGVDSTIFQNPDKLHVTLGVMALMDQSEVDQANQLLQECVGTIVTPILRGKPLVCDVMGLEYMNDDPGEVDVLYAKVKLQDASDRLQLLADRLVDRFISAGLMRREYDHVKLHVTVMNSLMRKDTARGPTGPPPPRQERGSKPRESFNARNVLRIFCDYDFGRCSLDTVHLSQRFSTGPDGYYAAAAELELVPRSSHFADADQW